MRITVDRRGISLVRELTQQPAQQAVEPAGYAADASRVPGDGLNRRVWTEDQWSLGWLADSYVNGQWGIEPKLPPPLLQAWRRHRVDVDRTLTPRDYLRIVVLAMVNEGTHYDQVLENGIRPLPPPVSNFSRWTGYSQWPVERSQYTFILPDGQVLELPADQVDRYFLRTHPLQTQGVRLFELVREVADERRSFILALIQSARLVSVMRLFRKRAGDPLAGADYQPSTGPVVIDYSRSGITDIGLDEEIISPSVSAPPVRAGEVDRASAGVTGRPYGISVLQASRDGSNTNYSSGRLAAIQDEQAWHRYQGVCLEAVRGVYNRWAAVASEGLPIEPEWVYPTMPSIDPHRQAQVDRQQIEDGVASRQMIMRQHGYDPDEVMREIEDWNRRFPSGVSSSRTPIPNRRERPTTEPADPDDPEEEEE